MEVIRSVNRNQVFLIGFTEHVLKSIGKTDYDMREVQGIVNSYDLKGTYEFFDKFAIAFNKYCQRPVELDGDIIKPIPHTAEGLLQEFKEYLATAPDSEQVDEPRPSNSFQYETHAPGGCPL